MKKIIVKYLYILIPSLHAMHPHISKQLNHEIHLFINKALQEFEQQKKEDQERLQLSREKLLFNKSILEKKLSEMSDESSKK